MFTATVSRLLIPLIQALLGARHNFDPESIADLAVRLHSPTARSDQACIVRYSSPSLMLVHCLTCLFINCRPDIGFAGSITHRGSVAPLALNTISISLWITRQGTHNIGGWSFVVSRDDVQWTENGRRREIRVTDARRTAARSAEAATLVAIEA